MKLKFIERRRSMKGQRERREPMLWEALLPILATFMSALYMELSYIKFYNNILLPSVFGIAVAASIGIIRLGYSIKDICRHALTIIIELRSMLIAIGIISTLMGAWIVSGIIPTFICYGVRIISPAFCLVAICLICSMISFITGSSHITAAGVGVALIAIASSIGIPAPVAAGAVISGISFGDKMSPLSFTTNLAPEAAGTDMKSHVKHMLYTTGVSLLVALICFATLGASYSGEHLDASSITAMVAAVNSDFYINPLLMLVPLVAVVPMVKKDYFVPGLIISIIVAAAIAILVQKRPVDTVLMAMLGIGKLGNANNGILDGLYNWAGFVNMFSTIARVLLAVIFGGQLEKMGMLKAIAKGILMRAKSTGSLIMSTLITSLVANMALSGKFTAIWTTGRMYKEEYERRGLSGCNLSRCLEDAGTLIAPLIPWGISGVVISELLGISTLEYLPFCFLNIINFLISIIYGYTGITIRETYNERSIFESK